MRIILLGHTGYLGSRIHEYFSEKKYELIPLKVDVTDLEAVKDAFADIQGQVVINATGKTGIPTVDWCESHRLETASVNITGAINVAKVASEQGNYTLQIGSGCIFDEEESAVPIKGVETYAYTEEDEPNFFGSFYSQSKAVAEGALKEIPNVCVLRIRMPLSERAHPKNLLSKLLQYEKILNLPNSVTVIEDFLPFLEKVIEKRVTGVLNAVNPGVYHHQDLLELYRKHVDPSRQFTYIGLSEFEGMTKAKRSNCVLSTKKSEALGIAMPPISESLIRVIKSSS